MSVLAYGGGFWASCAGNELLRQWQRLYTAVIISYELVSFRNISTWCYVWYSSDLLTFSWQAQYFWSVHIKIVKTYWNSKVKRLVDMSFLKEVSQKCFVFDIQSFIFEGSLAEMLRFWISKCHFWRKSRRKASFLSFKASILKEVSQKSFVFDVQSFNFEGSLAELLRFWASKLQFWRKSRRKASFFSLKACFLKEASQKSFVSQNRLNHTSVDIQITWISNQLTTTSLEVKINRQPKSFEAHIDWQPNHLNLKSIDNQNHLNLKSDDNQIIWLSTRLNLTSIDFRTNWTPHTPFL